MSVAVPTNSPQKSRSSELGGASLAAERDAARDRLQTAATARSFAEERLEAVEHSLSWRLAKPMRNTKRLTGRKGSSVLSLKPPIGPATARVPRLVRAALLMDQACVVCGTQLRIRIAPWSGECSTCGSWRSSLQPEIESPDLHEAIDAEARAAGLRELRRENNTRILGEIESLTPLEGKRLLDVGSAHGWFLVQAAERGMQAEGIEPEDAMVRVSRARGATVRHGYFPTALGAGEQVDVITFNDVLEHIPNIQATLAACAKVLSPGGVLSINIPTASGLAFRMAVWLAKLGVRSPYRRLWQFGLPSPHVHYLTAESLTLLLEREGFDVVRTLPLSSIRRDGLWSRMHMATKPSLSSALAYTALWLAAPLLSTARQSDIVLVLAQLRDDK